MRRSAGTGVVAVLPGNHEEFLREHLVPSRGAVWGTRFSMLDCHLVEGVGIYMIGILDRRY